MVEAIKRNRLKPDAIDTVKREVGDYIERLLKANASRTLTGSVVFEAHFSQGGLAGLDAKFTERLK